MMGQLRPHSGPTTACYRQLAEHSIVPGKELSLAALQRFVRPAADLTVEALRELATLADHVYVVLEGTHPEKSHTHAKRNATGKASQRARLPDCLIRLIWRQMEKLDNVTMITSPNDADGQLAYMCGHTVDAVLMFSDDTDMLLFPSCHAKAIFNVTFGQGDVKVLGYVKGEHPFSCKTQATTTKPSEDLDMSTWPIAAVMAYACMRGCDYGHIHGYGPVRAHQLITGILAKGAADAIDNVQFLMLVDLALGVGVLHADKSKRPGLTSVLGMASAYWNQLAVDPATNVLVRATDLLPLAATGSSVGETYRVDINAYKHQGDTGCNEMRLVNEATPVKIPADYSSYPAISNTGTMAKLPLVCCRHWGLPETLMHACIHVFFRWFCFSTRWHG